MTTQTDTMSPTARTDNHDGHEILEHFICADASASNVLSGVWGHREFVEAISDFVGTHGIVKTAFYDFDKAVGGDGMAYAPIDKRRCNTTDDDEIVVIKMTLETERHIGRFMALVEELDWAMEWGYQYGKDLRVVISPSHKTDY